MSNTNFFDEVADLYKNLYYGISKTLLYYHSFGEINKDMKDLSFVLKIILYKFNDFDSTVVNKEEEIKILSENKLFELIINLKNEAKKAYIQFLQQDKTIKDGFSSNILEIIDFNLDTIMPNLEKIIKWIRKIFERKVHKFFFQQLLKSNRNIWLKYFMKNKRELIQRLDDLFSSIEYKDLNEVNKNISTT